MGQSNDESKSQLIDPELNPALNPLLSSNMGKWAEVYFTSPPEKRGEAVADLIRQLALARDAGSGPYSLTSRPQFPMDVEPEPATVTCGGCGQTNPAGQRFCGMCGVSLVANPPLTASREASAHRLPVNLEAQAKPGTNRLAGALGVAGNEAPQSDDGEAVRASADLDDTARNPASYARGEADAYVPPANLQSHSLEAHPEQSPVEFSLSAYETERATRHYRVYIGIVLTMLLAWLVYATWHSNAKRSGDRLPAELPAPAIDAPASPAPGEGKGGVSASHASSPSLSKGESNSATASPGNLEGKGKSIESQDTMAGVRHPSPPTLAAQSRDGAIGENGAAELAAAEKYLKAGDGRASQAIPWLWKAVAKQNVDAALVLSDLYLRGDGVVKSCDQARLLLDAAARKGGTTAAEGTNRLLAFGCQ